MSQTLANIKMRPCTVTWNATDLGYTEGDIEIKFKEKSVDITAHQTGTQVLDSIRTGTELELTLTLKETSVAQLETLFEVAGGTMTPTTKASGWGSSRRFTGQLAGSQKLILHPVTITAGTLTDDIAFWKAYPMLDTLKASGENPMNVSITFKIFPDLAKNSAVDMFVIGDHTQTFT
jgi:hypothetical protein